MFTVFGGELGSRHTMGLRWGKVEWGTNESYGSTVYVSTVTLNMKPIFYDMMIIVQNSFVSPVGRTDLKKILIFSHIKILNYLQKNLMK